MKINKTKIMIVEDEALIADDIKEVLILQDYEITAITDSGEEAVKKAGQTQPDIILMDIRLKGQMDGITAAEKIGAAYNIPVIYLTAHSDNEILERAKFSNPCGFLLKPFRDDELRAAIETGLWKHQMISDLKEKQKQLEHEIQERKQIEKALKKAKQEAEAASRSKSEFLANMSHEIRTPMNAIMGFTEVLISMITNRQQKQYLKAINTSGKNLLNLINDILDLSKIEAGKLDIVYEPVNLRNLFNEIQGIFQISSSKKKIDMSIDIAGSVPENIYLDQVRLRQILFNLIGNAFKFTDKGYVKVFVENISQNIHKDSFDLSISVQDTGIGISPESQNNIFDAFHQDSQGSEKKYTGTGLGLTITKRLTNMMNGKIYLASEPGTGSTFTIIFYNVFVAENNEYFLYNVQDVNKFDNTIFKNPVVLVADDIKTNRDLIKAFVNNANIQILDAENGEQAVIMAEKYMPDLILMDIRMPVKDGYEAAKEIRNNNKLSNIPVIALTALAMKDEQEKIKKEIFDGYLKKPVDKTSLFYELIRFLPVIKQENPEPKQEKIKTEIIEPEIIEKLPEIINHLENKFKYLWQEVQQYQEINETINFAEQIKDFGKKYRIMCLEIYGDQLAEHGKDFDIEKISEKLDKYPDLIEGLKSLSRKQD
ncbi:Two component system response regulator/histidine kinase [Desulfonema limicola]|uniref:histidine kinase n=1 Tax=Desulfonema limicola TaxID=45656 RepID=A0A975B3T8_9BACT|nr:response regulator [Desulfonema limicola]QTA78264.1 Two component system response regulator/histidine kinase [Desulfonema limicola]